VWGGARELGTPRIDPRDRRPGWLDIPIEALPVIRTDLRCYFSSNPLEVWFGISISWLIASSWALGERRFEGDVVRPAMAPAKLDNREALSNAGRAKVRKNSTMAMALILPLHALYSTTRPPIPFPIKQTVRAIE
jgi:hypothetical protein